MPVATVMVSVVAHTPATVPTVFVSSIDGLAPPTFTVAVSVACADGPPTTDAVQVPVLVVVVLITDGMLRPACTVLTWHRAQASS